MRWWAVAALWANVCASLPPFQTLRKHLPSQSYCWYFTKDSHSSAPLVGWRSTVVMLPPLFMTQDCRTLGMIYTNTCETLWAITGKFTLFFHYKQFLMCLVHSDDVGGIIISVLSPWTLKETSQISRKRHISSSVSSPLLTPCFFGLVLLVGAPGSSSSWLLWDHKGLICWADLF